MRITQVTTCMQYPGTEQLFTKVSQEARNRLTHWFLLPGGGLPVYIYIYILVYIYIHINIYRTSKYKFLFFEGFDSSKSTGNAISHRMHNLLRRELEYGAVW